MLRHTLPLLAALLLTSAAQAQAARPAAAAPTPTELGTFGTWRVYQFDGPNGRQCYVLGAPQSSEPRSAQPGTGRRGATNMFITFRPRQNVRNEVSVMIGYAFRANSTATLEVLAQGGPRRFTLFTRDQGAWLQNAAEESQLIDAMRRGRELKVRGTMQRGAATTDTYSLASFAGAVDRAAQCRSGT